MAKCIPAAAVAALLLACLSAAAAETASSELQQQSTSRRHLTGTSNVAKCIIMQGDYQEAIDSIHARYQDIDKQLQFHPCNLKLVKSDLAFIKEETAFVTKMVKEVIQLGCVFDLNEFGELSTFSKKVPKDLEAACPPVDCKARQKALDSLVADIDTVTTEVIKIIGKSKCLSAQQDSDIANHYGPINGLKMSISLLLSHDSPICTSLKQAKQKVKFPEKIPPLCKPVGR